MAPEKGRAARRQHVERLQAREVWLPVTDGVYPCGGTPGKPDSLTLIRRLQDEARRAPSPVARRNAARRLALLVMDTYDLGQRSRDAALRVVGSALQGCTGDVIYAGLRVTSALAEQRPGGGAA